MRGCGGEWHREAQEAAKRGRDGRGEALVNLWRDVSKPWKEGAVEPQPAGCKVDFEPLFMMWLQQRGLSDALQRAADYVGWQVYKYVKEPVVQSHPSWETAYHGTWWYSVWSVLQSGVMLESDDLTLGHDFWKPGVYCTPNIETALWYARPHELFADGVYHRVIFELRVDPERRSKERQRGGVQWVFPSAAVSLHAVWVRPNAPPTKGEERVREWNPQLEALPPGCAPPRPIVNPRRSAWPNVVDEWPFELAGSSAPPWLLTPKPFCGPGSKVTSPHWVRPNDWEHWQQGYSGPSMDGWSASQWQWNSEYSDTQHCSSSSSTTTADKKAFGPYSLCQRKFFSELCVRPRGSIGKRFTALGLAKSEPVASHEEARSHMGGRWQSDPCSVPSCAGRALATKPFPWPSRETLGDVSCWPPACWNAQGHHSRLAFLAWSPPSIPRAGVSKVSPSAGSERGPPESLTAAQGWTSSLGSRWEAVPIQAPTPPDWRRAEWKPSSSQSSRPTSTELCETACRREDRPGTAAVPLVYDVDSGLYTSDCKAAMSAEDDGGPRWKRALRAKALWWECSPRKSARLQSTRPGEEKSQAVQSELLFASAATAPMPVPFSKAGAGWVGGKPGEQ